MEQKPHASFHLGYLDGLRALAATWVVLHHAFLQVQVDSAALPPWKGLPLGLLIHGREAVLLFIVLSGFCLMLPVARGDGTLPGGVWKFFKRRAWRILPPYYGALLLSLILIRLWLNRKTGTPWDHCIPVTAKGILSHIVMLQDAFNEDSTINHVFWSIAVEWRIYFLFPLLLWAWRKYGGAKTTLWSAVLSQVLYQVLRFIIHAPLSAHYVGLFAFGMLGASIAFSADPTYARFKSLPWNVILVTLFILATALMNLKVFRGKPAPSYLIDDVWGLAAMALIVTVSINPRHQLNKLLNWKPVVFTGTFAYSIYLIHAPLLQIFWQALPSLQHRPLLMFAASAVIGVPLILCASYLFFLVCERPFLRRKIPLPRSIIAKTVVEPGP